MKKVKKIFTTLLPSFFIVGMCLPAGPCVTDEDVRRIVETVKENID